MQVFGSRPVELITQPLPNNAGDMANSHALLPRYGSVLMLTSLSGLLTSWVAARAIFQRVIAGAVC
jgi:hypothetical protein